MPFLLHEFLLICSIRLANMSTSGRMIKCQFGHKIYQSILKIVSLYSLLCTLYEMSRVVSCAHLRLLATVPSATFPENAALVVSQRHHRQWTLSLYPQQSTLTTRLDRPQTMLFTSSVWPDRTEPSVPLSRRSGTMGWACVTESCRLGSIAGWII